jgi:hypothetical protein
MDLPHGDLTNDQSPSVAVHDEDVHQDISGVHQGIDPAPEAQLVPGTSLSSRREWGKLVGSSEAIQEDGDRGRQPQRGSLS